MITSATIDRTPTFSSNSAWEGTSKRTLGGWNAIGLERVSEIRPRSILADSPYHTFILLLSDIL